MAHGKFVRETGIFEEDHVFEYYSMPEWILQDKRWHAYCICSFSRNLSIILVEVEATGFGNQCFGIITCKNSTMATF